MKRGMGIYKLCSGATPGESCCATLARSQEKRCFSFYFDFFSWQVPHLPTAPGCIPGWHRAAKCVGWVLSIWAATFPHGHALSILRTATASRPCATLRTSTLIVMCKGVWEREGKGKQLPHPAWSRHPGINSYWLLFLSIAEKILFKWPWQWTLFCRELQEGSFLRAAAGACCSWGCESITKHLSSTCQSGL